MNEGSGNPPPIIAKDGHEVPHGTYTAYNRWKCRCIKCKAKNAEMGREWRAKREQRAVGQPRPKVVPEHGTRSRYNSKTHPCRCARCRKANTDYEKERQWLRRRGLTLKAEWE